MTEAEWLAGTDPPAMLEFLRCKASDRKVRLFAVACCRTVRHLVVPEVGEAIDVAERVAEGEIEPVERRRVRAMALQAGWVSDPATRHSRGPAKALVCNALSRRAWDGASGAARSAYLLGTGRIEALRELFGNPFRPVEVDPSGLTSTVVALAEGIYRDRAFDRMPILAEALMDAGCENDDVLNHCRGDGPHVRGCWVVDLLTGRA